MKISLNWLCRYIPLEAAPEEIEENLTLLGFEVESVDRVGLAPTDNLVVGEVLTAEKHPKADRLSVCTVEVGQPEPCTIVCGAKNFKVGDRVPVALPGAILPGGFEIKEAALRGVTSSGMMCSARELGLGEDHSGLMILEERPAIGTAIHDVVGGEDVVFDIEVTPNRPDCLSHLGIARELAAWYDLKVIFPTPQTSLTGPLASTQSPLIEEVFTDTPENCPHYRAYSVRGVKIAPSPAWLQGCLRAVGLRPINNVVDVTNFVLLETGHPLHAFDAAKIRGGRLGARLAKEGERITTLDEKERSLNETMTVIADRERALVVAGVMGSLEAEVDDETTDVVLEAAWFNPPNIRATSRRLGLSSDSSYRYERGVDPQGAEYAALRTLDLIVETAGGEVCGPALVAGEPPLMRRAITISPQWVNDRLGFEITPEAMRQSLEALELEVRTDDAADNPKATWEVAIPSFRFDLERPVDLVEEILRLHGTHRIPETEVKSHALVAEDAPAAVATREMAQALAGRQMLEVVHYTMRSEEETTAWSSPEEAKVLRLLNPLASDQSHLRVSLLPGLLDALKLNSARLNEPVPLFETGRVFHGCDGKISEWLGVAFVLPVMVVSAWKHRAGADFYHAAAIVRQLLELAGISTQAGDFSPVDDQHPWQAGRAGGIGAVTEGWVARAGVIRPAVVKDWDIDGIVVAGEVKILPEKLPTDRLRQKYESLSLFPPSTKDLALLVAEDVPAVSVEEAVQFAASEAVGKGFGLEAVKLFDVYTGKGVPEGQKSLAFNLRFRAPERTLTDKEVNEALAKTIKALSANPAYTVRG